MASPNGFQAEGQFVEGLGLQDGPGDLGGDDAPEGTGKGIRGVEHDGEGAAQPAQLRGQIQAIHPVAFVLHDGEIGLQARELGDGLPAVSFAIRYGSSQHVSVSA